MTSRSVSKPPETLRHRILEITLQPARSNYPISLKILADSQVVHVSSTTARAQVLRWSSIPPCDVKPTSHIEIRVYELHTFGRKRIGTTEYGVADIGVLLEISRDCNSAGLSMSVIYPIPQSAGEVAAKVMLDAKAMERQKRLLEKLGPVKNVITTVFEIGGALAELDPRAKAAFAMFKLAWEKLVAQEKCDASVEALINGLSDILPSVEAVNRAARLEKLQDTIKALCILIEDASRFVIEYKSTGEATHSLRGFTGSHAQGQVDEMLSKLRGLKETFDRGINIQMFQTIDENVQQTLLKKLKPVGNARYDATRACMPGTRKEIIRDILQWAKQDPATIGSARKASLMWIYGQAGLGKSAIATSVCQELDDVHLLAASFFCKRDDSDRRSPQRILASIIFDLAIQHPNYADSLQKELKGDPLLASSPMQMQFDKLVQRILTSTTFTTVDTRHVVVVDALDECKGNRQQLLEFLLRILHLLPSLRIIISSRPDSDIRGFFDSSDRSTFETRDVYEYDASNDIHTYIKWCFSQSPAASLLPIDATDSLATKSAGLFIWARTACEFVLNDDDPPEALYSILDSTASGQSSQALDDLYETAVNASVNHRQRPDHAKKAAKKCLGAIIVCSSRAPLSINSLSNLYGERISEHMLQLVVNRLRSVLYIDRNQGDAVRVYHASFADYMLSRERSNDFSVDVEEQNTYLAGRCLDIMIKGLKFNICGLETSYKSNSEVLDMDSRIAHSISRHLEYSCIYWVSHLTEMPTKQTTGSFPPLLETFLTGPFVIYWIEVLSLLVKLDIGLRNLENLQDYYQGLEIMITKYIRDIRRFMQTFSQPIRESTPHIYISALAFLPSSSVNQKLQKQQFPNTIKVSIGIQHGWARWTQLITHYGAISSVKFSSDGRRIVSCSSDATIKVWDAETGALIGEPLVGHLDSVYSVAFSSDSRRIVSGSRDKMIRVWDAETGAPIGEPLVGHSDSISSVVFSPDGCCIISGSMDQTMRVWDTETGVPIGEPLVGHSGSVNSVVLSSDGRRIVSGSSDRTIRVWEVESGAPVGEPFVGHSDSVFSVAFSSDGLRVVSGSRDTTVRVWKSETGAPMCEPLVGHSRSVCSVVFSPNGRRVISCSSDKTIRIWDAESGAPIGGPLVGHSDSVYSISFSSDGRRVVSGSRDNTIRVWNAETGASIGEPLFCHSSSVEPAALSSQDRQTTSGSNDETLQVRDPETDLPIAAPLIGHSDSVHSVAFSYDGCRIISGSYDKTIRVWSAETGALICAPLVGHSDSVNSIAFSFDGCRIVSCSSDKTVRVWDAETGAFIGEPLVGHTDSVLSVAFSPDGRRIVSGSRDKTIRLWDAETGAPIGGPLTGHSYSVASVEYSSDGHTIVSHSYDQTIRVWDAETGASIGEPIICYSDLVTPVARSPDGRRIVSILSDQVLLVWDPATGARIGKPLIGHSSSVSSAAFSPDSRRIVSGSYDRSIRVWDTETGASVGEALVGHSSMVLSVAFSADGRRIISGSADNTIRLWDAEHVTLAEDPLIAYLNTQSGTVFSLNTPRVSRNLPASVEDDQSLAGLQHTLLHQNVSRLMKHCDFEGWVCTSLGERLFWLPPEYRRHQRDDSLRRMSSDSELLPVWLDLSDFRHGSDWMKVFAQTE